MKEPTTIAIWLVLSAALMAFTNSRAEAVFHVAPAGDDNNPGTLNAPYAPFERARQAVPAYEALQGPTELLYWDETNAFTGNTWFGVRGTTYLYREETRGRVPDCWSGR